MPLPEKALISEIRRLGHNRQKRLLATGIGDDCAVLSASPDQDFLVTTDFSLEDIHFRRQWHSPESVGHRCCARGLSDIAAMGGQPVALFLSLALPEDLPQAWVTRFILGLTRLVQKHGAALAGGDTAQSSHGILADIILLGRVPKGKAVLRSDARPGDRIFVTGKLGGAAAAVVKMEKRSKSKLNPKEYRRHFFPEPRIEVGRVLREKELARAMIDISDGLSTDLAHMCEESGVGAEIDSERIPRAQCGKSKREVSLPGTARRRGLRTPLYGTQRRSHATEHPWSVSNRDWPNHTTKCPALAHGEQNRRVDSSRMGAFPEGMTSFAWLLPLPAAYTRGRDSGLQ